MSDDNITSIVPKLSEKQKARERLRLRVEMSKQIAELIKRMRQTGAPSAEIAKALRDAANDLSKDTPA